MRHHKPAVFSVALLAVAAATLSGAGTASARTTGYHIWNFTSEAVKLTGLETLATPAGERVFSNDSDAPKPPRRNMIIQPGEQLHVELENPLTYTRRATLEFEAGQAAYWMELDNYFGGKCRVQLGNRQCQVDGGRVQLLEPPGTVHRVKASNIQEQAKALQAFCTEANHCQFEPEKEVEVETPSKVVGKSAINCPGGEVAHKKIKVSQEITTSDSVGIDLKTEFTIFKVFKTSITLKYKHERSESHTFGEELEIGVPPGKQAWIVGSAPAIADIGEFKMNVGNTEWILEEVTFYSPNPNSKSQGKYIIRYHTLTPEEIKASCEGEAPEASENGLILLPPSSVATQTLGTALGDLLVGGPESNTLRGLGAHDIIRGGGGDDTLLGGGGNDLVKGGRGEDTINGGPGSDRVDDVSGPTTVQTGPDGGPGADRVDVADGVGDDSVECQASNSVVLADPGDEVDGNCGLVVRDR